MIKVLIAEDMKLLRRALVSLLSLEPDIDVVAEVESGTDVVPRARAVRPDVAVLDIGLPGIDGIEAASALRVALPECRTLILTGMNAPGHLRRAAAAKVSGFLLKNSDPDRFSGAIREIAAGGRVIDASVALAAIDGGPSRLTTRELQVLRAAADGNRVADIADQMWVCAGTVRNHLNSVVAKLNARNRVDAIRIARDEGWL
ncbi:response regulator transcription factor [Embleya sp. NPDC001921]